MSEGIGKKKITEYCVVFYSSNGGPVGSPVGCPVGSPVNELINKLKKLCVFYQIFGEVNFYSNSDPEDVKKILAKINYDENIYGDGSSKGSRDGIIKKVIKFIWISSEIKNLLEFFQQNRIRLGRHALPRIQSEWWCYTKAKPLKKVLRFLKKFSFQNKNRNFDAALVCNELNAYFIKCIVRKYSRKKIYDLLGMEIFKKNRGYFSLLLYDEHGRQWSDQFLTREHFLLQSTVCSKKKSHFAQELIKEWKGEKIILLQQIKLFEEQEATERSRLYRNKYFYPLLISNQKWKMVAIVHSLDDQGEFTEEDRTGLDFIFSNLQLAFTDYYRSYNSLFASLFRILVG
ncbi:MAG: hypothetical protein HQK53_04725 [Oligoflexia bacterium]|nr:hypothetical protein [Oligoflexia bacterium]